MSIPDEPQAHNEQAHGIDVSRLPDLPPTLRLILALASGRGVELPPPLAAVRWAESGSGSFLQVLPTSPLSDSRAEASRQMSDHRGDGSMGVKLALHQMIGGDFSSLYQGMSPTAYKELLSACGTAPLYTVVDSGSHVAGELRTLLDDLRMSAYRASSRANPTAAVSRTFHDRLSRTAECADERHLDKEQRLFVETLQRLLPGMSFSPEVVLSPDFLDQMAALFYGDLDDRRRRFPLRNVEQRIEPFLRAEDVRCLVLPNGAGPFSSLRPLVESLLPVSIARTGLRERLEAHYPDHFGALLACDSGVDSCLEVAPRITVDQLTVLKDQWKGVVLSNVELGLLADFLNGQVSNPNGLGKLLYQVLSRYRVLAKGLGRCVGVSSGAVAFGDRSSLDSDSQRLVERLLSSHCEDEPFFVFQGAEAPAEGTSESLSAASGHDLRMACLQKLLGVKAGEGLLSGFSPSFSVASSMMVSLPPAAALDYFESLLRGLSGLARSAWMRSSRENLFDSEALAMDSLRLESREVPVLGWRTEFVLVRPLRPFDLTRPPDSTGKVLYLCLEGVPHEVELVKCEDPENPPEGTLWRPLNAFAEPGLRLAMGQNFLLPRRAGDREGMAGVEFLEGSLAAMSPQAAALYFYATYQALVERARSLGSDPQDFSVRGGWTEVCAFVSGSFEGHRVYLQTLQEDSRCQPRELSFRGATYIEFFDPESGALRRIRRDLSLDGAKISYLNRVRSLSALGPLFDAFPEALLSDSSLNAMVVFGTRYPESDRVLQPDPIQVHEVQTGLPRDPLKPREALMPFSSLRAFVRSLLPPALGVFFEHRPVDAIEKGRVEEVGSFDERLRADFPEAYPTLRRSVFPNGSLSRVDLITRSYLERHAVCSLWGVDGSRVETVLAFLNGRAEDTAEFRELLDHLVTHYAEIAHRLGRLIRDSRGGVLVWDVNRSDVDSATQSLMRALVADSSPSDQRVLMVAAVPYPSNELGVSLDILVTGMDRAREYFIDCFRANGFDKESFNAFRQLVFMVARHADVEESAAALDRCMVQLFKPFLIDNVSVFKPFSIDNVLEYLNRAVAQRVDGKLVPAMTMRFWSLFLEAFLHQGEVAVAQGAFDAAMPAWRVVDAGVRYLSSAMDSVQKPFKPEHSFEGGVLLGKVDESFAFLGDLCLAGDSIPGHESTLHAVRSYLNLYRRFYGGDRAAPLVSNSPVGCYLETVIGYKEQNYELVIAGADHFFPSSTNMPYIHRLQAALKSGCPAAIANLTKGLGLPGFAHVGVLDTRVLMPVAVMAIEAICNLAKRAQGVEDRVAVQGFVERYEFFVHQLGILFEPGASLRARYWAYQAYLQAEHVAREVVGNIDAAEMHCFKVGTLLKGLPSHRPEWVRLLHFFQECDRERFNQAFKEIRESMENPKILQMVGKAYEHLLMAFRREGQVIQRASSSEVEGREWLMYFGTQLELALNLVKFHFFVRASFPDEGFSEGLFQAALRGVSEKDFGAGAPALFPHANEVSGMPDLEAFVLGTHRSVYTYFQNTRHQYIYWYAGLMVRFFDAAQSSAPAMPLQAARTEWVALMRREVDLDDAAPAPAHGKKVPVREKIRKEFGESLFVEVMNASPAA